MKNYPYHEIEDFQTFRELFETCREKYAGRDMLRVKQDGGVRGISCEEFLGGMSALGNAFAHMGLLQEKIAVVGETSVPWLTAYFAASCGGAVVVPIDKELPEDEIAYILNDSGARCVVYSPTFSQVMKNIEASVPGVQYFIGMEDDASEGKWRGLEPTKAFGRSQENLYSGLAPDGHSLAAILYTSGTTGKSKGVMLTQHNFLSDARGTYALIEMGDVCMSTLPIHHSFEFTAGIVLMLMNGTTICINDSLRYFAENLQLFRPNMIFLVPAFVDMMLRKIKAAMAAAGQDFEQTLRESRALLKEGQDKRSELFAIAHKAFGGNMKLIVCGGAPLSAEMMKTFREMGLPLLNGYGITECSPVVSCNRNGYFKDGAIGLPCACNEVKIVNPDENGDGELHVRGTNVMLGYYKNEEATRAVLQDGWFNTEDIAHIDGDGFIFITGRKKNLIVLSNGKNIYPEEIEGYLSRIPYIKEVVVYSRFAEGLGEVQLYAEMFLDEAFTEQHAPHEIKAALDQDISDVNKTLPTYKQVQDYTLRDSEFEKTTKKSIKRFKL